MMRQAIPHLIAILALLGCGKEPSKKVSDSSSVSALAASHWYFHSAKTIELEVFYEPGAEPFVGNVGSGIQLWNIVQNNLNAIFQYRSTAPSVIVPKDLSAMSAMPGLNKTDWTSQEISLLNSTYKSGVSSSSHSRFYLYFVKGRLKDQPNVIGANITGTPLIVIFKDVISNTGGPVIQKYVEQSTIVHELGHALGFVNIGVPMKNTHLDQSHGAHTTNSNCVMYWKNEGQLDLINFVAHFITAGTTVMWGPEVLLDVQNFSK